ncbi:recombinase [Lentibacillus cibarius]|uniref:Recombinase n=2 Tax=Lentibacillus cibarius TaxID=2583219 RepID=A0A5S3QJ58_9BACI|nr:recombinase [Lentibacillus cibarius]
MVRRVFMLYADASKYYLQYLSAQERSEDTLEGYEKDYRVFRGFIEDVFNGPVYIEDVTRDNLENYMIYLKEKRKLAPRSRNRYISSIRSLFEYAEDKGWIEKNVASKVKDAKVPEDQKVTLTEDEVDQLINEIDKPLLKTLVIFMYRTGLRITSAINLRLEDVDLDAGTITACIKEGKIITIHISEKLYPTLVEYLKSIRDSDSPYFFATKKTGRVSPAYMNAQLRAAVKRLGWNKKVTSHTLRRSFATNLLRNGVELPYISKLLGHESVKTTMIYLNILSDDLKEAINKL